MPHPAVCRSLILFLLLAACASRVPATGFAEPQAIERGPGGLTLTVTPGYDFQGPTPPKELAGVLVVGGGPAGIEPGRIRQAVEIAADQPRFD